MTDTNSENEISFLGKLTAGLLLVLLTATAIFFVIAFWPNKMPPISQGDEGAWYSNQCFNVTLIEDADPATIQKRKTMQLAIDSLEKSIAIKKDSTKTKADTLAFQKLEQSRNDLADALKKLKDNHAELLTGKRIHLNTILLLLVALMGFLGNMIHIATSLTTFVGMGTFERNWVLWYFVKPFTAAALAIIMYFIIRAGFLSYGSGASSVSLYGILALAALAGLFTDSATLKLKEVFEVIFKPRDERTGKLQGDALIVSSITPNPVPAATTSILTVTGKNLNLAGLKISIDGKAVTPAISTNEKLEINYTAPATTGKATLVFNDSAGKMLLLKEIDIK